MKFQFYLHSTMRSTSQFWIYLPLLLITINVDTINSSKYVRTVRRGPGSDPQCMSSLIKSREEFPDSAFSASSTLEDRLEFQPYQARLTEVYGSKEHTSGHAWCPGTPIEDSLREWIQAEFTDLVLIGAIFTAGRGDGNVKEFMPSFVLKYQREDDGPWFEHVKRDGTKILKANSDPRNLARATLDSMVIAKRIRIYPYSREGKQQVCLRFALYGCKFPDGVVSYSMSQGGDRSPGLSYSSNSIAPSNPIGSASANFRDLSYDGQMIGTNDHLTDGMGQLMDNVAYLGNVTNPLALHPSQPGFHFVGWYPYGQTDVPIVFKFDTTRTFTWVRLFTYDSIPLRARLFSRVVVAFSLDGHTYNNSVEVFTGRAQLFDPRTAAFSRTRRAGDQSVYAGVDRFAKSARAATSAQLQGDPLIYVDQEWDGALVLEADLGGRIGRYVRVSLTATDGWILLSEVQFNSTIAKTTEKIAVPASTSDTRTGSDHRAPIDAGANELSPPVANSPRNQGTPNNHQRTPSVIGKSPNDMSNRNTADTAAAQSPSQSADETAGGNLPLSARDSFTNPLPFIIAIAVLLFLLSTVVLIWLCTRRHQKRSQMRLHRKGLIGSDSGKTGFHPSAPGGIHHVPGMTDVPGVMGVHEATKLLSPPYPGLSSNLSTASQLANGAHPASGALTRLNEPNQPHMGTGATMNGPATLGLPYPGRPGPGVILPCSPSSSCSSHASGDPMAAAGCSLTTAVSTMASPVQAPATTTDMPNIYAGTDLGCMTGYSASPQTNFSTARYLPAFIALPTGDPAGGFVLQPVNLSQSPMGGFVGLAPLGTPDSGSLYTSIRLSSTPPVRSVTTSIEPDNDLTSPRAVARPNVPTGEAGGQDTDDDVAELREDITLDQTETRAGKETCDSTSPRASVQHNQKGNDTDDRKVSTSQSCDPRANEECPRHSGDGQTQSDEVVELQPRNSKSRRASRQSIASNVSRSVASKRCSGFSLPDGAETPSYANAILLSSGSSTEGVAVHVLHHTPSGFIIQPYGPEYASASLFGFTPPPSEAPCSSAPPTCTESMPATNYRPSIPNYTVSFARPGQGLVSGTATVYAGPASMPVNANTLRLSSQHTTPNPTHRFQPTQAAGVLFLPHSALGASQRMDDPTGLYQARMNGFSNNNNMGGTSYNIYQTTQSSMMCPTQDGQRTAFNSPQETWMLSAHPGEINGAVRLAEGRGVAGGVGLTETSLHNPVPVQLLTANGLMDLSQPYSPNVSPQHFYPGQLIFPSVPPLPNRPPMDPSVRATHMDHQSFSRASPVGANASVGVSGINGTGNAGGYVVSVTESARDGASSGRLSIYSVCI